MMKTLFLAITSFCCAEILFLLPYHAVNGEFFESEKMVLKEVTTSGSVSESIQKILKKKEQYRKGQALQFRVQKVFQSKLVGVSQADAVKLAKVFMKETSSHQFEPAFVLALIEVESNFMMNARSSQGAVGLMQLLPSTAKFLNPKYSEMSLLTVKEELLNPEINIKLGIQYLGYLRAHLKRSHERVSSFDILASYLIGPDKYGKLKLDPTYVPSETLTYFNKVEKRKKHWLAQL